MAGWESIGQLAGVPANNELSYQKGLSLGANTQNAMQEARERVRKNQSMEQLTGLADELGIPPALITALQAGINPQQITGASKDIQERGFRATAGNPDTSPEAANIALRGVASAPVERYYSVGAKGYADKFNDTGVMKSPAGSVGAGGGDAAAIQIMRAYNMLDENDRVKPGFEKQAFDIMRSTGYHTDIGGVPAAGDFNPFSGMDGSAPHPAPSVAPAPGVAPAGLGAELAPPMVMPPAAAPVVPTSTKPAGTPALTQVAPTSQAAQNVAALAAAKQVGEAQGTKAAALPSTLNTLGTFTGNVDKLLAQPGFDSIYGHLQGTGVGQGITQALSQDASNASAARDTLKSDAFTVAIQKMRGLGQLSNMEGQKVESALTRMFNPRISPPEARKAAVELKAALASLEQVARKEAGDGAVNALLSGATPGAGATAPNAGAATPMFSDPAKQARYEAWKAAQGK